MLKTHYYDMKHLRFCFLRGEHQPHNPRGTKMTKTQDPKITAMADATKASWIRAKLLITLAGVGLPAQARQYLSANPEAREILDRPGKKDKRNRACRKIANDFEHSLKTGLSDGHSTTKRVRPTVPLMLSPEDSARFVQRVLGDHQRMVKGDPSKEVVTAEGDQIPFQALLEIRETQKRHNLTISELAYTVSVLGDIISPPRDLDR